MKNLSSFLTALLMLSLFAFVSCEEQTKAEKAEEKMEETAEELYKKLNKTKRKNTSTFFEFFEAQNHGDVLHLAVYSAFEKVFERKKAKK